MQGKKQDSGTKEKPPCPIIGADGNIFNLMGMASRTLRAHGMDAAAKEMRERMTSSSSYDEALAILMEYVEPVSAAKMERGFEVFLE